MIYYEVQICPTNYTAFESPKCKYLTLKTPIEYINEPKAVEYMKAFPKGVKFQATVICRMVDYDITQDDINLFSTHINEPAGAMFNMFVIPSVH